MTRHHRKLAGLLLPGLLATMGLAVWARAQDAGIQTMTAEEVHEFVAQNRGKAVVVNFWASWCPPCVEEFPAIVRFYNDYRTEGLEVLAVSMNSEDEIEDIQEFLANYDTPFPVYRAVAQDETFLEGISENWFGEMPTTLIFDTEGNAVGMHKRQVTYEDLAAEVTPLLSPDNP